MLVKVELKYLSACVSIGSNSNGNYLRAEATGVGSGLGKEIKINLDSLAPPTHGNGQGTTTPGNF